MTQTSTFGLMISSAACSAFTLASLGFDMNQHGFYNLIFWSALLGIYASIGVPDDENDPHVWAWLAVPIVGILMFFYYRQNGVYDQLHDRFIASEYGLLGYALLGSCAAFSIGVGITATINYALNLYYFVRPETEQSNADNQDNKFDNRNTDYSGFDESDFDYDETKFKPKKAAPKKSDATKRHPSDKKLWAFVDDPEAAPNERITAMKKIADREAKRKGKTSHALAKT